MARNLEARVAKLEAERNPKVPSMGIEAGRGWAELCSYTGPELEAKAMEFAALPAREHEERLGIVRNMDSQLCAEILLGPEKEIGMFYLLISPSPLPTWSQTFTKLKNLPEWQEMIIRMNAWNAALEHRVNDANASRMAAAAGPGWAASGPGWRVL